MAFETVRHDRIDFVGRLSIFEYFKHASISLAIVEFVSAKYSSIYRLELPSTSSSTKPTQKNGAATKKHS